MASRITLRSSRASRLTRPAGGFRLSAAILCASSDAHSALFALLTGIAHLPLGKEYVARDSNGYGCRRGDLPPARRYRTGGFEAGGRGRKRLPQADGLVAEVSLALFPSSPPASHTAGDRHTTPTPVSGQ
jgi:hypothetical protein